MDRFYLYRFLDKNRNVLYIGRTNDIARRILKEHFTPNTHLPPECYLETEYVEYAEFLNESEEVAYEAILINQLRPKYNIQFKDDALFTVSMPEIVWRPFAWEFENQLDMLKVYKQNQVSVANAIAVFYNQLEKNTKRNGPMFGFQAVDMQSILMPCTTALVAACSGEYKTAYALHIAQRNAQFGKKVFYINLKDSADELAKRMIFANCHIGIGNNYNGLLTEVQWKRIAAEIGVTYQLPITFYNHKLGNGTVEALCEEISKSDCDIVIIDDLNTIEDFECSYDNDKTLRAMKKIKGVALERRIPIVSLYCMSSREVQKRGERRPLLTDLLHSSLQSYNDIIQLLYLPNDEDNRSAVEIITAKSNGGSTGTAVIAHAGNKLVELAPEPDELGN